MATEALIKKCKVIHTGAKHPNVPYIYWEPNLQGNNQQRHGKYGGQHSEKSNSGVQQQWKLLTPC